MSEVLSPNILVLNEVVSTQDEAKKLWQQGSSREAEGFLWLQAERQTQGRGRQSRKWEGRSGNLFLSAAFALPSQRELHLPLISLIAAFSVYRALSNEREWADSFFVKWPNDLCLLDRNNEIKKWGGILAESFGTRQFLCGWGLNLVEVPANVPHATSLNSVSSVVFDAKFLAEKIALGFESEIALWLKSPSEYQETLIELMEQKLMKKLWGRQGQFELGSSTKLAKAIGLSPSGYLRVEVEGQELTAAAGEFRLW